MKSNHTTHYSHEASDKTISTKDEKDAPQPQASSQRRIE
jgi:hypothetical protein